MLNRVTGLLLATIFAFAPIAAFTAPFSIQQAIVWVRCGNRQGSGVVINSEKGYVLTNAHVLLDLSSMTPESCEVGFITPTSGLKPEIFYDATWDRFSYDESANRDFAILEITDAQQPQRISPFPFIKTDEFSEVGDPLSILAYPAKNKGKQLETNGIITGLERGIVKTNAEITPGSSGGGGINDDFSLTGIATRILIREIDGVEEVVDYELVDIRAVLAWLDTFGENLHDEYVTHAEYDRYHLPDALFTQGQLSCSLLARSIHDPAVYCLRGDGARSVFPNKETYFSWFSDFSGVETLADTQLANYRLVSNITMKPGTLVKIQTDPKVYLVSDINGTLRWIRNEQHAVDLYGEGWAGFVQDVPVTFFINYRVGIPID